MAFGSYGQYILSINLKLLPHYQGTYQRNVYLIGFLCCEPPRNGPEPYWLLSSTSLQSYCITIMNHGLLKLNSKRHIFKSYILQNKECHQTKQSVKSYISIIVLSASFQCANQMVMLPTGAKGKQLFHFHQMAPQGRQLPRFCNH